MKTSGLRGLLLELVDQAFLVVCVEVTECYGSLSLDTYVLGEHFLHVAETKSNDALAFSSLLVFRVLVAQPWWSL